jgi:ribokinase
MDRKKVTVVGSYNVGLFLKGDGFPSPGETVIGTTFHQGGGGKGSNQALAAAKLGADVTFVGRIGPDDFGRFALRLYEASGVSTAHIARDESVHSGVSVILIDATGRNLIMVVPGANFRLTREDIDRAEAAFAASAVVGFQLETNLEIVEYAVGRASDAGARVLLDPAPARSLPDALLAKLWCIKPNEHEASTISGVQVVDVPSAVEAGRWFLSRGVQVALVTLGERGAVLVTKDERLHFSAPRVKAVDTTGAGDTFCGAFMAALAAGESLQHAIRHANCAASVSVTRLGVVEAIPTREEALAVLPQCEVRVLP